MFARQSILKGWDQAVLKDAAVFILGVGALGCEIAKDLALVGVGKLVLCDLDTIETSNLSRQMLFRPGDEGRPKAEVAAERLKEMNPFMEVDFYFQKLQEIPMAVYEECDVIIAALDNIRARMDLNEIAIKLKKPMVEGGTVGFEGHVQVIVPEGTGIEYGNLDRVVEAKLDEKLWALPDADPKYKEYFAAEERIAELEAEIYQLQEAVIDPVKAELRAEILQEVTADREQFLDHTACYRCLVPIPPADQKLIAACTLKGIPQNREHCALRGDVLFRKKHERAPDFENDDDVAEVLAFAQDEFDKLRERVFNENLTEEEMAALSDAEKAKIRQQIRETFGPDFIATDMENIIGNKIPAIQTVSSIISSLESQEALKLLFRVRGRDIGPPMDPPYVNYNGVYGQFDAVPVARREDCVACGHIKGVENVEIVAPAVDGKVSDLFVGMRKAGYGIDETRWLVTVPMLNNLILWDPSKPKLKDPDFSFKEAKLQNGAMLLFTAMGDLYKKLEAEGDIFKYNVLLRLV